MTAIANGCRRGTRGTTSRLMMTTEKRDAEKEEAEQADRDQELGQLVRSNAFQISSRRRRRREL